MQGPFSQGAPDVSWCWGVMQLDCQQLHSLGGRDFLKSMSCSLLCLKTVCLYESVAFDKGGGLVVMQLILFQCWK